MSEEGRYQKQHILGSGERVDVFLGLNVAFDRKVAIKELRGGIATSDAERKAFYKEYEQWAKFENRGLAQIADIDHSRAWVIQEFLPDSMLDSAGRLANDKQAAYTALEQLLEGLVFLHSQGFLHCNLKASNVRFSGSKLKLCDGRCVKIGFPGVLAKPRGSNRYLAPEMINEEFGSVGPASDIYVAAIVFLEALAGDKFETLFQGYVSGTPDAEMGWVRWHNSPDQLEPISTTVPSIPKPLADILDGMLCKEVRLRHASAERLLEELHAAREAILTADTTAPAATPTDLAPSSAQLDAPQKEPSVKLIDRPGTAVYVRCLSGPLAGSIFPLPMGEVIIGTDTGCNVRLSPEQYPSIQGRTVHISLGGGGWKISDPQGHPVIVDLKKSFEAAPIRSGSILRLSSRGPDFQFVVQGEHALSWQDISSQLGLLAPEAHSVPSRLMTPKSKTRPSAGTSPARPHPATDSSTFAASAPAPPTRPIAAKENVADKRAAKIAKPAAPSPALPPKAVPMGAAPGRPVPAPVANESFLNRFNKMDKNKRNNLVLILGLPLAAILVILFTPRSKSNNEKNMDQQSELQTVDGQDQSGSPRGESVSLDKKPPKNEEPNSSAELAAPEDLNKPPQQ